MPHTPPISTNFWRKPGPTDAFDWSAWYEDDEPNDDGLMDIGHGRTEQDAINDLLVNFPRCHAASDARGGTPTDQALAAVAEWQRQRAGGARL